MGRLPESAEKKHEMFVHLIKSAEAIISEEGMEAATIRSISKKAGCNSASLYKYFEDLDELLLYACIKSFREYIIEVAHNDVLLNSTDKREKYYTTWRVFCKHGFIKAECVNQLFFSKHSHNISKILRSYFNMFPEELDNAPEYLTEIMHSADIKNRNWRLLQPLLEGKATMDEMLKVNELTIAYYQMLLGEKLFNKEAKNNEFLTKRMLDICEYLTDRFLK